MSCPAGATAPSEGDYKLDRLAKEANNLLGHAIRKVEGVEGNDTALGIISMAILGVLVILVNQNATNAK